MVRYLKSEEVLYLHHQLIEQTSGSHGVRDMNLFLSTIDRPKTAVFGEEQFSSIFEKAACYLENFAGYQVFVDGNKRTALATAVRFLYINNYIFQASDAEVVKFVLKIANKKVSFAQIAVWLERHSISSNNRAS